MRRVTWDLRVSYDADDPFEKTAFVDGLGMFAVCNVCILKKHGNVVEVPLDSELANHTPAPRARPPDALAPWL